MATFGPIASANPNVLFDPARAIGAAQDVQRNALLMDQTRLQQANAAEDRQFAIGERDHAEVARISAVLMGAPAEQRATLYPQMVTEAQQRGLLRSAPTAYPGDTVIAAKAQSSMTPQQILARQDLDRDRVALGGMFGAAPGAAPAAGGGQAPAGAPLRPFVASNLPAGVDPHTDQVVRTVLGEAGGEDDRGQQAVAHVILNRAKQAGIDTTGVIFAPNQFEPWNNPQTRAKLEAIDPASPQYQRALAQVRAVQGGQAPDPTGGATHFYSPTAQTALGRSAPSWDNGSGTDLGRHRFFNLGYAPGSGAPGAPPARGVAGRTGGTDMAGPGVPGGQAPAGGIVLNPPGTPDWAQGTTAEDQVRLRALAQARGMTREKLIDEASKMAQANRLQQRWEQAHPPASPDAGPFTGNGIEPQVNNTLLRIGPKIANGTATEAERQQYALAHGHLARGTVQLVDDGKGGQVLARIPGVVPPSFPAPDFQPGGSGSAPAVGGGGAAGQGAAQPIPGATKSAPLVTPAGREAVRKIEQDVTKADEAIANFLRVHAQVGGGGVNTYFNNPRAPGAQRLLGAFEAMKAALRTEAFLNTGVLQPAEAKMLDDTLLSPQSARGALASREALEERLGQIRETLKRGVGAARKSAGMESEAPGGGGGNVPPPPPGFTVVQ